MTAAVADKASASTTSATAITITLPGGAPSNGDVLVAAFNISQFSVARDLVLPTGFTVIDSVLNVDVRTVTISGVVGSNGLVASASYTFNFTGSAQTHAGVLIRSTGSTGVVAAHGATSAADNISVTPPNAGDLPLVFFTQNNGNGNGNTVNSVATGGWTTDINEAPGFHAIIAGHGPATSAGVAVDPTPAWGGTVGNPGAAVVILTSTPAGGGGAITGSVSDTKDSRYKTALSATTTNITDLEWQFFSANSGLTPASKFSISDHKQAYYASHGGTGPTLNELEISYRRSKGATGKSRQDVELDFFSKFTP